MQGSSIGELPTCSMKKVLVKRKVTHCPPLPPHGNLPHKLQMFQVHSTKNAVHSGDSRWPLNNRTVLSAACEHWATSLCAY